MNTIVELNHGYKLKGNVISNRNPYDNADYYYATKCRNGVWSIRKDGKLMEVCDFKPYTELEISDILAIMNAGVML